MNARSLLMWLIVSVITPIAGYNSLWFIKPQERSEKFCFITIAAYPLILCCIFMQVFKWLKKQDIKKWRWHYRVSNIFMWLLIGNLLDEIFFDPTDVNVWEYAFSLIVILVSIVYELKPLLLLILFRYVKEIYSSIKKLPIMHKIFGSVLLFVSLTCSAQMHLINSSVKWQAGNPYGAPCIIATPKVTMAGIKLPLVISCHGSGEAGSDTVGVLRNGLPATLASGYEPPFDFIMVAPQRSSYGIDPAWLYAIVADMEARYPIDPTRIYLTGYSAGGWAVYGSQMNIDTSLGKLFAALAPLSAATQDLTMANIGWVKAPVWDIAGAADQSYAEQDSTLVGNINAVHPGLAYYESRAGFGHGPSWTDFYNANYKDKQGRSIWDFLYSHQLGTVSQPSTPTGCGTHKPVTYTFTTNGTQNIYKTDSVANAIYKGGDTIRIMAGNYADVIEFDNLHGDACNPITIINGGGVVQAVQMRFKTGCSYIHVTGSGTAGIVNGFKCTGGPLTMNYGNHIEIDHIDITNPNGVGIYMTFVPNAALPATVYIPGSPNNYSINKIHIHHNKIHSTAGEGMYIGNSAPDGDTDNGYNPDGSFILPARGDSIEIDHNTTDSTGWDGIQLSNSRDGCSIHDNTVNHYGLINKGSQQAGIISGSNTSSSVYNNRVTNGTGNGIQYFGYGTSLIYGNYLSNCGYDGTPTGQESILVDDRLTPTQPTPLQALSIYLDTIMNPTPKAAIFSYYGNKNTASTTVHDNIICNPTGTTEIILNYPGSVTSNNINSCAPAPPVIVPTKAAMAVTINAAAAGTWTITHLVKSVVTNVSSGTYKAGTNNIPVTGLVSGTLYNLKTQDTVSKIVANFTFTYSK